MRLLLILLTLALALPCAAQDLKGVWRCSGELPASGSESHPFSWMKEYTFEPATGIYLMTGYPPIEERGKYTVTSQSGPIWKLRMHERTLQKKAAAETTVDLKWAEDGKSFSIGKERYISQKKK